MPPLLRAIAAVPELGLRVLAAADALDREVSWVAVSELEDPTPYLEGGELLLTTGMRLPADLDADVADGYVGRVAERGVVGLGLGVGLGHNCAPAELVRAADRHGLALFEVPRPTPFIAIGKTVSKLLIAEQHEEARRAFEAARELTRAALRPEHGAAVIARLARELAGWALLLDVAGRAVHASPPSAARRAAALGPEVDKLRAKGLLASSVLADRDGQVALHPLGVAGRTRGFLAIGVAHALSTVDRSVVNTAISLLSLELEKSRAQVHTERELRRAVVHLLLTGVVDPVREVATFVAGGCPREPVRAILVGCGEASRDRVLDAIEDDGPLRAAAVLAVADGPGILIVAPADEPVLRRVLAVLEPGPGRFVGVGAAVPLAELAKSAEDAAQALALGRQARRFVIRHDEMAGVGVLGLLDAKAARAFSSALLAPLESRSTARTDLVASLRAFLAHNGQWDPAAAELGVHRHTLRYRMRRVAELLERDLDSATTRMELWLALQVRERQHASRSP